MNFNAIVNVCLLLASFHAQVRSHIHLDNAKECVFYALNSTVRNDFIGYVPEKYATEYFKPSIINFGNLNNYQRIREKLGSRSTYKTCLSIVAFGGSVTCAHTQNGTHPDRCITIDDAWPIKLEALLNFKYNELCIDPGNPHRFSRHTVLNLCQPAVGTDLWITKVSEFRMRPGHPMLSADMIIMETAVNDVNLMDKSASILLGDDYNKVTVSTEILVRQLMELPNKPALLWLGASSHSLAPWVDPDIGDAVPAHKNVTIPYEIPHISMVHGFRYLSTPQERRWYIEDYRVDACCHVTRTGQRLISFYVMDLLESGMCLLSRTRNPVTPFQMPSLPLFIPSGEMDLYTKTFPLFINLAVFATPKHYVHDTRGFRFTADVAKKPGLIGMNVSDSALMMIPWMEVVKHCLVGVVTLEYLSSYERMGSMRATLLQVPARYQNAAYHCDFANQSMIDSKIVDSLSKQKVSVSTTTQLHYNLQQIKKSPLCLGVNVTIVPSKPVRPLNKVKLLGVMFT